MRKGSGVFSARSLPQAGSPGKPNIVPLVSVAAAEQRQRRRPVHVGVDAFDMAAEALVFPAFQLAAGGEADARRIDLLAVDQHLVMQVRPGGAAGGADAADDLTLADALALVHVDAVHMRIGRGVAVGMLDAHILAVAAVPAGHLDDAVAGRLDRRADGGAEITALVHQAVAEDRMAPHAELGAQPRAVDRR